jgi:hypothetical protein
MSNSAAARPAQSGAVTHHQERLASGPVTLRMKRTMKKRPQKPIPPLFVDVLISMFHLTLGQQIHEYDCAEQTEKYKPDRGCRMLLLSVPLSQCHE